ncbi:MAG: S26 family signal peptidase [Bryobacteraceae bacterium]|nr:S26 family signal peptidase [Bryobacterales bacterium]MEB2362141.1 S26 family signal peptidase [Bryobacterales bacterium]NUN00043.1 S26 family signal peptidase [Bryobacteraceae bacterium]
MLRKTDGRFSRIALRLVGFGSVGLAASYIAANTLGVRINTSYSLPMGVYIETSDLAAPLVEFCPTALFAKESSERGYRTAGLACGDGAVPLLKPIVAREGDLVETTARGIKVNGALLPQTAPLPNDSHSRPLKPWPFGVYRVQAGTVWVASSYNRGSYDSRYMGPIATSQIRRRLRALWVL